MPPAEDEIRNAVKSAKSLARSLSRHVGHELLSEEEAEVRALHTNVEKEIQQIREHFVQKNLEVATKAADNLRKTTRKLFHSAGGDSLSEANVDAMVKSVDEDVDNLLHHLQSSQPQDKPNAQPGAERKRAHTYPTLPVEKDSPPSSEAPPVIPPLAIGVTPPSENEDASDGQPPPLTFRSNTVEKASQPTDFELEDLEKTRNAIQNELNAFESRHWNSVSSYATNLAYSSSTNQLSQFGASDLRSTGASFRPVTPPPRPPNSLGEYQGSPSEYVLKAAAEWYEKSVPMHELTEKYSAPRRTSSQTERATFTTLHHHHHHQQQQQHQQQPRRSVGVTASGGPPSGLSAKSPLAQHFLSNITHAMQLQEQAKAVLPPKTPPPRELGEFEGTPSDYVRKAAEEWYEKKINMKHSSGDDRRSEAVSVQTSSVPEDPPSPSQLVSRAAAEWYEKDIPMKRPDYAASQLHERHLEEKRKLEQMYRKEMMALEERSRRYESEVLEERQARLDAERAVSELEHELKLLAQQLGVAESQRNRLRSVEVKNRELETEVSLLTEQLHSSDSIWELENARKNCDNYAKEVNRLRSSKDEWVAESDYWKDKYLNEKRIVDDLQASNTKLQLLVQQHATNSSQERSSLAKRTMARVLSIAINRRVASSLSRWKTVTKQQTTAKAEKVTRAKLSAMSLKRCLDGKRETQVRKSLGEWRVQTCIAKAVENEHGMKKQMLNYRVVSTLLSAEGSFLWTTLQGGISSSQAANCLDLAHSLKEVEVAFSDLRERVTERFRESFERYPFEISSKDGMSGEVSVELDCSHMLGLPLGVALPTDVMMLTELHSESAVDGEAKENLSLVGWKWLIEEVGRLSGCDLSKQTEAVARSLETISKEVGEKTREREELLKNKNKLKEFSRCVGIAVSEVLSKGLNAVTRKAFFHLRQFSVAMGKWQRRRAMLKQKSVFVQWKQSCKKSEKMNRAFQLFRDRTKMCWCVKGFRAIRETARDRRRERMGIEVLYERDHLREKMETLARDAGAKVALEEEVRELKKKLEYERTLRDELQARVDRYWTEIDIHRKEKTELTLSCEALSEYVTKQSQRHVHFSSQIANLLGSHGPPSG